MTEKQGVVARLSDPVGTASITIRITEGRGGQFKFATGHSVLRGDHWNETKQRVRNKVEAVGCDEVNVQLEKLQAFVRQAHLDAKTKGQRRDRDFYLQVIQDFKRGVERSSVGQTLTIGRPLSASSTMRRSTTAPSQAPGSPRAPWRTTPSPYGRFSMS